MAKVKKAWFCSSCGNESSKWLGKCPACGEWNTMIEEIISKESSESTELEKEIISHLDSLKYE